MGSLYFARNGETRSYNILAFDQSRCVENLSLANGVKLTNEELDKLYLKDESSLAYEPYKKFENFSRSQKMSISDYAIKFEQLHQIAKSQKMDVLDGVLPYKLLNNVNLPKEKKQLVRATVNKMK